MQALVSEVRVRVSGQASGRLPWNGRFGFGRASKRQQQVAELQHRPSAARGYPVATTYFRKRHTPGRRRRSCLAPHEIRGLQAPYARPRGPLHHLVVAIY